MSDYLSKVLGAERDDDDNERIPKDLAEPGRKWEPVHLTRPAKGLEQYTLRSALPSGDFSAYHIEGAEEVWKEPAADNNEDVPDTEVLFEVCTYQGRQVLIRKASIAGLRPDFTIVSYGKRRTGKSEGFKSLLYCVHKWYPKVFVLSGTIHDREWNQHVPEKYIVDGFNASVLEGILAKQQQRVEAMRARGVNDKNLWILIILDDCIADGVRHEETLRKLFFNGRHLYIACWITSQDMKGLPPAMCANTDMVMMFPVRSQRDKEAVREKFLDYLKNDQELDELLDEVQRVPYVVTWADQSHPNTRPEECVWAGCWPWHGDDRPRFFAGSKSWWKGSEKQLGKYGGQDWLNKPHEEWEMMDHTYRFYWG